MNSMVAMYFTVCTAVFDTSQLVITKNAIPSYLEDCIGSVIESNQETSRVYLLHYNGNQSRQSQSAYGINTISRQSQFVRCTVPNYSLRELNYKSDTKALQNRDKVFATEHDHQSMAKYLELRNKLTNKLNLQNAHATVPVIIAAALRDHGPMALELCTTRLRPFVDIHAITQQYNSAFSASKIPINHGDFVLIKQLKEQNAPLNQALSESMSHSIGTIMKNVSEINKRNQTLCRIQSMFTDQSIKLKRKYFNKLTKIYFVGVNETDNPLTARVGLLQLMSNPNNDIMFVQTKFEATVPVWAVSNPLIIKHLSYNLETTHSLILTMQKHAQVSNVSSIISTISIMHFIFDPNAFLEAMDLVAKAYTKSKDFNWTLQMKEIYETNINLLPRGPSTLDRMSSGYNVVTKVFPDPDKVMKKPGFIKLWQTFLKHLSNIYMAALNNIRLLRVQPKRVTLGQMLSSDIMTQYLISKQLGRDLFVIYQKPLLNADVGWVDIRVSFQIGMAQVINIEWNIMNIRKAATLSNRLCYDSELSTHQPSNLSTVNPITSPTHQLDISDNRVVHAIRRKEVVFRVFIGIGLSWCLYVYYWLLQGAWQNME
eukprot:844877_1